MKNDYDHWQFALMISEKDVTIAALRAENANLRDDITSINIAYDKLYEESARLREALKPFADEASSVSNDLNGGKSNAAPYLITVTLGHLRAARAAMGETE